MTDSEDLITGHPYQGTPRGSCQFVYNGATYGEPGNDEVCGEQSMSHADPGNTDHHLINVTPHDFKPPVEKGDHCAFTTVLTGGVYATCGYPALAHVRQPDLTHPFVRSPDPAFEFCDYRDGDSVCGWPEKAHLPARFGALVRKADVAEDPWNRHTRENWHLWSCLQSEYALNSDGYAVRTVNLNDGRSTRLFVVAWEDMVGRRRNPELHLDHLCRNRWCVEPMHGEEVTVRENTLRGEGPSAANARKTCCPKCGGPFSFHKQGFRYCKPCRQENQNTRRRSQRAQ